MAYKCIGIKKCKILSVDSNDVKPLSDAELHAKSESALRLLLQGVVMEMEQFTH
jgi:hypothetical protein